MDCEALEFSVERDLGTVASQFPLAWLKLCRARPRL
jgi:hypothetical protein